MVTVAQTIKYLNADALRRMRFAALLPTHMQYSTAALISLTLSLFSLTRRHTQIQHKNRMSWSSPSQHRRGLFSPIALCNHLLHSRYCQRASESKLIPPELFTEGITEEDSREIIFPLKAFAFEHWVEGGSSEHDFWNCDQKVECFSYLMIYTRYFLESVMSGRRSHLHPEDSSILIGHTLISSCILSDSQKRDIKPCLQVAD